MKKLLLFTLIYGASLQARAVPVQKSYEKTQEKHIQSPTEIQNEISITILDKVKDILNKNQTKISDIEIGRLKNALKLYARELSGALPLGNAEAIYKNIRENARRIFKLDRASINGNNFEEFLNKLSDLIADHNKALEKKQ